MHNGGGMYEQFCVEQNKNILLEERFSENGECSILCHHRHICQKEGCPYLERLRQSIQISKNLQN